MLQPLKWLSSCCDPYDETSHNTPHIPAHCALNNKPQIVCDGISNNFTAKAITVLKLSTAKFSLIFL